VRKLEARLLQDLRSRGYHYERDMPIEDCLAIANLLGKPVGDVRNPEPVRFITPQGTTIAKANTLSSRYGLGEFPFHTDAAYWQVPPELILFCSVSAGSGKRPTLLVDPRQWRLSESERRALYNEVWKVIGRKPFLCTVATEDGGDMRLRFDEACMVPVTVGAHSVHVRVKACIEESCVEVVNWREGDLLIVDNCRLLHARGRAEQDDEDRILARVLIRR